MNKISEILINTLKIVIIIIMVFFTLVSIKFMKELEFDYIENSFFILEIFLFFIGIIIIFSNLLNCYKICSLLLIALLLRLSWIFSINTMPMSDFNTMYESAKIFLEGDTSIFKDYTYLGRFPHLIPMTLYMAGIIKLFPISNLIILKILNVIFSCISVFLLYRLADNFIKLERNKLLVLLIGAVFPPSITYTSVLCTENLAIPLYLLTLILFFKAKEGNKLKDFIITGVFLALSNLFRGIAVVFLIAFYIFFLLVLRKKKLLNILSLGVGYLIITVCISGILLNVRIINRPLWAGVEPSYITLLLKGSNFESNGMWSTKDAEFVDEYLKNEDFKKICLTEIKERVFSKTPTQLIKFYLKKIASQWSVGDCFGTYWAYSGANKILKEPTFILFQGIYVIILSLAVVGQINSRKNINLLMNIILFGMILLFSIIETQPRYAYIISWVFIIFAVQGIEYVLRWEENKP